MHTQAGRAIAVPGLRNFDVHPGTGTSVVLNPGTASRDRNCSTGGVRVCVCMWT